MRGARRTAHRYHRRVRYVTANTNPLVTGKEAFMKNVPDTIIRKMTGHTSAIMERYKHLDSRFADESVERIGGRISEQIGTFSGTLPKSKKASPKGRVPILGTKGHAQ